MTAYRLTSAFFLICLISTSPAHAQEISDTKSTEERLELLKMQIEEDQRKLSETAEAERATVETLEDLNRQVTLRTELIRN
jgi:nicotinic acid mononucleotide adenylyltransferase